MPLARARTIGLACVVACCGAAAGCGEGDPPAAPTPLRGVGHGRYVTFKQGLALAAARRKPLLLLVGTASARCPPALRLEGLLLEAPGRDELGEEVVLARLDMDERTEAADRTAFEARYPQVVLPALYLLAPDGDLLEAISTGLYGCYDLSAQPLPGFDTPLATVGDLRGRVRAALERDQAERAALAAPAGALSHAQRLARAEVLLRRARRDEAREVALAAPPEAANRDEAHRWSDLLAALGESAAAARVLRAAEPDRREPAAWIAWSHRMVRHEEHPARALAQLKSLAEQARATGLEPLAARITVDEVARARELGLREQALAGLARLEAALPLLRTAPDAPVALDLLAENAHAVGRVSLAVKAAEELLRHFPGSPEAQKPKHGLLDQWRREARSAPDGANG